MAHFAHMLGNVVQEVIGVRNVVIDGGHFPASEILGQQFIASIPLTGEYLQCSYSGAFRGCYPRIAYTYDPVLDLFQPPTDEVTP